MPRQPKTETPEPETMTPPSEPETPRSLPTSAHVSPTTKHESGLRSQLEALPRLIADQNNIIKTNMSLLQQQYASTVDLQKQQYEMQQQAVAQLNALFQVAEEFLSNLDEIVDKLIEETAAIVQLRSDLAAEALAQTNSSGAPNGTTPSQG